MPTNAPRYWDNTGKYQKAADALTGLVPVSGSVPNPRKNKRLERYRRAVNCYYDLYNNGLYNRAAEFTRVFGIAAAQYRKWRGGDFRESLYADLEPLVDAIVRDAAEEQGLMHLIHEVDVVDLDARVRRLTAALTAAHNGLDVARACVNDGRSRDFIVAAMEKSGRELAAV